MFTLQLLLFDSKSAFYIIIHYNYEDYLIESVSVCNLKFHLKLLISI